MYWLLDVESYTIASKLMHKSKLPEFSTRKMRKYIEICEKILLRFLKYSFLQIDSWEIERIWESTINKINILFLLIN